jgi:hypothetical protein
MLRSFYGYSYIRLQIETIVCVSLVASASDWIDYLTS